MSDRTNDRKVEHIQIINTDRDVDRRKYYFDEVYLTHRALPELDLAEVDTRCTFMGKTLSFPLLISCMTGGHHELVRKINRNLALAAEATGVALGVGSQRVMFTRTSSKSSFDIRPHAPKTLLFSNIGAVQLNYGFSLDMCREALQAVGANALYFHLNPLQEAVQPEGDTNFKGLAEKIGAIARSLEVPVIVKEVGAGISPADAELLISQGIQYLDVAGAGGTSWSRIENHRAHDDESDLGLLFQDWGLPTPLALRQLSPYRDRVTLVASGGIRSGVDMAKAMVLGASLCGMASPFLRPAMESPESVIKSIERLKREFKTALFLLGQSQADQLIGNSSLLLEA